MDHVYLTHSTRPCKNEASPGNVMNINNFANIQYKYPGLHTLVGFNFRNAVGSDFILAAEPNEVASFRSNPQYIEVDTLGYCSPGGGGQHCDHFYTASAQEKDAVVQAGGRYVRIVCYLFIPEACC
uniref:Uncharacterized protein n=1 Tax=Acrobeloides nanus TaxID=290746 RepID=A0A914E4L5_9BILA